MTGTVIVSYSLGVNSSVAAPIKAPTPADNNTRVKSVPCVSINTKTPTANETISIAVLPSHDFLPSVNRHFTLCFPKGIPTNAAAASPVPHIRIEAAASSALPNILNDYREDTDDSRAFGAVGLSEIDGPLILSLRRRGF